MSYCSQKLLPEYLYVLDLSQKHGRYLLWMVGILGIILSMIKRDRWGYIFSAWILLIFLADIFQSRILGISITNPSYTIISLAIHIPIFAGLFVNQLINFKIYRPEKIFGVIFLSILALAGGYNQLSITNPEPILFTTADQKAMDWIDKQTFPSDIFLIDSLEWGGQIKPSDGGGWILNKTGRRMIQMDSINKNFDQNIVQANYVYLGTSTGVMDTNQMMMNQQLKLVYDFEGVKIFRKVSQYAK